MAPDKGRASGFLALLEQGQEIQTTGGCMNIYEAIMKAADHIENNPHQFSYLNTRTECGSPACALGWIGYFSEETREQRWDYLEDRSHRLLGIKYLSFEDRLYDLAKGGDWKNGGKPCAVALRLYAHKYHAKPLKTDAQLVQDLMRKITTERIPEDA